MFNDSDFQNGVRFSGTEILDSYVLASEGVRHLLLQIVSGNVTQFPRYVQSIKSFEKNLLESDLV